MKTTINHPYKTMKSPYITNHLCLNKVQTTCMTLTTPATQIDTCRTSGGQSGDQLLFHFHCEKHAGNECMPQSTMLARQNEDPTLTFHLTSSLHFHIIRSPEFLYETSFDYTCLIKTSKLGPTHEKIRCDRIKYTWLSPLNASECASDPRCERVMKSKCK